jgi:hypothetical protein
MHKPLFPFFFAAFGWILFTGCPSNEVTESKHVAQSEIYQIYSVSYSEENNTTDVNAEFRLSGPMGNTLALNEPSDVLCNGEEMKLGTYLLGGVHYTYTKSGLLSPVHVEFIDAEKKSFKNSFKVNEARFADNVTALNKYVTNTVSFTGPDPEAGEILELELRGDSLSASVKPVPGQKAFQITKEDLAKFGMNEKVTLSMTRSSSGDLPEATARGGTFRTTFYSKKMRAVIK